MKKVSINTMHIAKWLGRPISYPKISLEDTFKLYEYSKIRRKLKDMFNIIESDSDFDVTTINVEDSIIICDPDNTHNKRSKDGKFDIFSNGPIDPTLGRSLFNGSISEFIAYPRLKISSPYSINLSFDKPIDSTYHNTIYETATIIECGVFDENDKNCLPTHKIYTKIKLIIYFDLYRLRNDFKVPQMQKATPLTSIKFEPFYYLGQSESIIAYPNVYYIKNAEIFRKFEEIFS